MSHLQSSGATAAAEETSMTESRPKPTGAAEETSDRFSLTPIPGGHFFDIEGQQQVVREIVDRLT